MSIQMHPAQQRLAALGEVLLCSSVPTQLLVATLLVAIGMPHQTESGGLALPYVVTVTLIDTALLIVLMIFFTRRRRESISSLWLGTRPVAGEIGYGLALVPVIFLTVIVLLNTMRMGAPWLHNVEVNPLEQLATGSTGEALLFGVVVIIAGGVREELVRAFLLRRFEQHLGGAAVGVVVLGVAFGLGHFNQGLDAVITTGVLGVLWSIVYLRRRSSIAPIVSHAGFNSLEVLRIAVSGLQG
jgi:membrane protease YdiL (CAAX protease family)